MAEVFAGFTCGFVLSLLSAPVAAVTLLHLRPSNALLARLLPEGSNVVALTIALMFALIFFWTGLGVILGLILMAMNGLGDSAPGLKNPPYTLLVLSVVLAAAGPITLLLSAWWRQIVAGAVASFLIFGALMPYMAEWSKFDGPVPETNKPAPPPNPYARLIGLPATREAL